MRNVPRNLPKRNQHEPPLMQPRMRNLQPLRPHHHVLPAHAAALKPIATEIFTRWANLML